MEEQKKQLPLTPEELKEFTKRPSGRPSKDSQVSPQLKAVIVAMFKSGAKPEVIVSDLGIPMDKVKTALRDIKNISASDLENARVEFASEISNIVHRMLNAAQTEDLPEKLAKTAHNSTFATTLGVLIDKINVLTGNATQIIETQQNVKKVNDSLAQIEAQRKELLALRASLNGTDNPTAN